MFHNNHTRCLWFDFWLCFSLSPASDRNRFRSFSAAKCTSECATMILARDKKKLRARTVCLCQDANAAIAMDFSLRHSHASPYLFILCHARFSCCYSYSFSFVCLFVRFFFSFDFVFAYKIYGGFQASDVCLFATVSSFS